MNKRLVFRRASIEELPQILRIIRQAQAQMRALGSAQWQDGYPAETDIVRDLNHGWGYVLADADRVAAYGAAVFSGEAAYEHLIGQWLTAGTYVVVHRLAVADEVKRQGVAAEFLGHVEALARAQEVTSFRIDTNFDNHYMLRLLERRGFTYCGKVFYASGERLAFEKRIG